jgi:hypothetical protein
LSQPPDDEEETPELALLNPIVEVNPEDELYHGKGAVFETFDSHLVIPAHSPGV